MRVQKLLDSRRRGKPTITFEPSAATVLRRGQYGDVAGLPHLERGRGIA